MAALAPKPGKALQKKLDASSGEKPLGFWQIAMMRLRRDRLTMAAIFVLLIIALGAVFAGVISEFLLGVDPNKTEILVSFEGPSRDHLLGTDALGRDQLARLLFGGRISLFIGLFGTIATLLLGLSFGMTAAYFGGALTTLLSGLSIRWEQFPVFSYCWLLAHYLSFLHFGWLCCLAFLDGQESLV